MPICRLRTAASPKTENCLSNRMQINDLFASSYQSLLRTKGRSLLTMLGIVIGITAVILALSIGESAQKFILSQVSGFGSDVLFMESGTLEGQTNNPSPFVEQTLKHSDLRRIKRESWVEAATGNIFQMDLLQVDGKNKNINVTGTTPDDLIISNYKLKEGIFFAQDQLDSKAKVAVIGYDIERVYFGQGNAVGKRLKLGKTNYRVIGVLDKLGTKFFQNLDEMVFIPATTMMENYNYDTYQFISVKTPLPLEEAKFRLEVLMRELHNIDNPEGDLSKDDFYVASQEDAVQIVEQITGVLQILLAAIAAISLLVGGIGIMNIMYVSVTERIKEIGLRKALGAKQKEILNQFITESVILTLAGGVGGVVLGSSLAWLIIQIINGYLPGWDYIVSLQGVSFGVIVSTAIGLIFGYAPAKKAADLDPIVALRSGD